MAKVLVDLLEPVQFLLVMPFVIDNNWDTNARTEHEIVASPGEVLEACNMVAHVLFFVVAHHHNVVVNAPLSCLNVDNVDSARKVGRNHSFLVVAEVAGCD